MSQVSHNTYQLKQINVELVKNSIKLLGTATKASIAEATRLSVATCGTILNELVQSGEVMETGPDESKGGRPARQYKYNADFAYVLCLLVKTEGGIHSITYALANLLGELIQETTLIKDHINEDTIDNLIGEVTAEHDNIQAVGIGIPGVVHEGIIGICDVPDLAGKPLGPRLEQKYKLKVTIENDMNMTVYGFYNLQNFEGEKTFAVVTFPKNQFPGAGFIVDGRILSGNTNFGGEVSYLPFGMTREAQMAALHSPDGFVPLAVSTLISIIAVINPIAIVLTGELPSTDLLETLNAGCLQVIPEEHMPRLQIRNNTHQEYLAGLTAATLESLAYHLQVVEKR
ncbi:transcriptional regulator [Paenibacillus sp. PK3_47]|uniref:ROK family protein n=1 Tax=Paenibacillus sp. PK3_47 TaxID=2072642 RepID=UPI00201DB720|nr:ROK family protein [Paenibacillus sp. PK3_47]UQZ36706.1 transcriptional regulator [Paenibacillus sp. PK3_47]